MGVGAGGYRGWGAMMTMDMIHNGTQHMATERGKGRKTGWLNRMLAGAFALMLLPGLATAYLMGQGFTYTPIINPVISSGHVMARAQVIGPNGGPILVKVRSSGSAGQSSTVEIEEIGEAYAGGPLDGVYVLSGAAYRDVLRQLTQLRARYPERMARAEFLSASQLASGLLLADESRTPGVTLPDHIKTVVVWGRQDRLSMDTESHILLTAPFQLDASTALSESVSSVLMNPDGSVRSLAHGSGVGGDSFNVESFTWRTAFYAQPGSTEQSDQRVDRNQDTIFGPISNAILEQMGWFGTMYAATDADGYYFINSPMLCMRNSYGGYLLPGMDSNLILTVPTVPFNPNRLGIPPYFEIRDIYAGCSDSFYPYRMDFLIDVLWLVGELHLSNTPGGAAIPVGSSVSYEGQDRTGEPTVRVWDYDGDGESDTAILADKLTVTDSETGESFVIAHPSSDGQYQAVYFSSGTRSPDADALADRVPDLWRLADRTLDGRPTGLLTEISEDALRHTDVYIFRESTGELLVEVSGLPEGPYAGRASRIENNAYLWHTLLRGRESVRNNFAAYGTSSGSRSPTNEDAFRERSAELGFSSRYQSRDADMPAPGEMLHVVAINRVTGYTGSVRFELGAANSPGGAQQRVPRLELLPPNVRVWAQRLTEIEAGLTAGEQREYLISHEGAHTANDLIVGLYTDWRTADGSPLPNALGQLRGADFGLTGRLAKVRDGQLVPVTAGQALDSSITLEDALAAGSQGAVAEFPIGPGQNLQLLRLPNAETGGNEHYYVNLFGRALNKEVCSHCQYDQAGLYPTLAGRPNHFAPVFVPRYDQVGTDKLKKLARELEAEAEGDEDAIEVDPQYLWTLRPEYQFSQIDFRVDEIEAVYYGDEGNEFARNLLHRLTPVITSSDDLIRALYSFLVSGEDALDGFDGQREYVLALGEEEIRIPMGADESARLENIQHLAQLEMEDFFTIRLYLNHDPENVLWEWAFEYLTIFPNNDHALAETTKKTYYVWADSPQVDFFTEIVGYKERPASRRDPVTVHWQIVGDGTLSKSSATNMDGYFSTTLIMPPVAGAAAKIRAYLDGEETSSAEYEREVIVLPAEPAYINLEIDGALRANQQGGITVTGNIFDAFGNPVLDGTLASFDVTGSASIESGAVATTDGLATAILSGGDFAWPDNFVTLSSGNVNATRAFVVRGVPVRVDETSLPESVEVGTQVMLPVALGDVSGVAASTSVSGYITKGKLHPERIRTDEQGVARFSWHSGYEEGSARFVVEAATGEYHEFYIEVTSAQHSEKSVGALYSSSSGGSLTVPLLSGDTLNIPAARVVDVSNYFTGAGVVQVGSDFYPNRHVRAAIVPSLYGLSGARSPLQAPVSGVSVTGEAGPRRSLAITNALEMILVDDDVATWDEPWIVMELELDGEQSGEVVSLFGKLSAHLDGDDVVVSLEQGGVGGLLSVSLPRQIGSTQRLAFGVSEGSLLLTVGNQKASVPLLSNVYFNPMVRSYLFSEVTGKLIDWRIYDLSDDPLMLFGNGQESQIESEPAMLLTLADFSVNHRAVSQRVDISAGDGRKGFVSLIPEKEAVRLAGLLSLSSEFTMLPTTLASTLVDSAAYQDPVLSLSRAMSDLVIRDEMTLADRLDSLLYWLDISGVEPLSQHDKRRLHQFFRRHADNKDFSRAVFQELARRIRLASGQDDRGRMVISTPVQVLLELLEVEPTHGDYMADAIRSPEQARAWFNLFATPSTGWVGIDVPIPDVRDTDCRRIPTWRSRGLDSSMPVRPCRLTGEILAAWLSDLLVDDVSWQESPEAFSHFLIGLHEWLPFADHVFRGVLFGRVDPDQGGFLLSDMNIIPYAHAGPAVILRPIKWFGKLGTQGSRNAMNYFRGKSNHRVDPKMMLFIFWYLESRMDDSEDECIGSCKKFDSEISRQIKSKINSVMRQIGTLGRLNKVNMNKHGEIQCSMAAYTHGYMYELMMIAYFHARHELAPAVFPPILEVERREEVYLRHKPDRGEARGYGPFVRRWDIVLGSDPQNAIAIETKSLQAFSDSKDRSPTSDRDLDRMLESRFPQWEIKKRGRSTYHRQILLDHAAARDLDIGGETQRFLSDYKWYFQTWSSRGRTEYIRRDNNRVPIWVNPGIPFGDRRANPGSRNAFDEVRDRLASTPKQNKWIRTIGQETYGQNVTNGYHIPQVQRAEKMQIFDFMGAIRDAGLGRAFAIPHDVDMLFMKLADNLEVQLIVDIIEGLDDYDPLWDLPLDSWRDSLFNRAADIPNPFAECD